MSIKWVSYQTRRICDRSLKYKKELIRHWTLWAQVDLQTYIFTMASYPWFSFLYHIYGRFVSSHRFWLPSYRSIINYVTNKKKEKREKCSQRSHRLFRNRFILYIHNQSFKTLGRINKYKKSLFIYIYICIRKYKVQLVSVY